MSGKQAYTLQKQTALPYFSQDVHLPGMTNGMYVVMLITEKEQLTGKFVRQ